MAWTKEQETAIYKDGTNIIVSAGAGSGKTAVLTERVLEKVKNGISVDNLLILTFTKMAAKEMRERIGDKLKKAGLTSELSKLDTADITTFDAYALSLVKKYHYYLNVSKDISIIDASVITLYKRKVLKDIFNELYEKEIRYCSDRKEEKDHGADKGNFLGSNLKDGDRVVMIEDVTTSGKSMEETVPKVKGAADVTIVGLMVSLDRMEVGKGGEKCALDEVKDLYGFETNAIVTMSDVVEHLYNKECNGKVVIDDEIKEAIDKYYAQYGAK